MGPALLKSAKGQKVGLVRSSSESVALFRKQTVTSAAQPSQPRPADLCDVGAPTWEQRGGWGSVRATRGGRGPAGGGWGWVQYPKVSTAWRLLWKRRLDGLNGRHLGAGAVRLQGAGVPRWLPLRSLSLGTDEGCWSRVRWGQAAGPRVPTPCGETPGTQCGA